MMDIKNAPFFVKASIYAGGLFGIIVSVLAVFGAIFAAVIYFVVSILQLPSAIQPPATMAIFLFVVCLIAAVVAALEDE
jgi:hypothetical protein